METTVHSTKATEDLAKQLASKLDGGSILALYGDLGAGKTTFTRFLVKHLGSDARVQSPTFVIARKYKLQNNPKLTVIHHLDLYRLKSKDELADLDLAQFLKNKTAITIIEWPEIAEDMLQNSIKIRFEYVDETSRKIYVENNN